MSNVHESWIDTSIRWRGRMAWITAVMAGLVGAALMALLVALVVARGFDVNLAWIPETARILFLWSVAAGAVSVSLSETHFKVSLFGADHTDSHRTSVADVLREALAVWLLAFALAYGWPTIERASMQPFAAIPLSYSALRLAMVVALAGMLTAHVWLLAEKTLALAGREQIRS